MTRATPHRLWKYVCGPLRLSAYFRAPGDGRGRPQIPAAALVWALVIGQILRECSFHGVEALVRSPARRALGVARSFGDDTLGYFTERLAPGPTRTALAATVRRAKRNKAFGHWIGLALDGTAAGHGQAEGCALCHPVRDAKDQPGELVEPVGRLAAEVVVETNLRAAGARRELQNSDLRATTLELLAQREHRLQEIWPGPHVGVRDDQGLAVAPVDPVKLGDGPSGCCPGGTAPH